MTNPAHPSTAIAIRPASSGFGLAMSPATIEAAEKFCHQLAKTEFVPKAFRNKPDSIMVVGAMGARLGVDVFTAMAGIADINGKPAIYGDLMLAVCQNHPDFEDCVESTEGKPYDDTFMAICTAKRKGRAPVTRTFSVIEAKEAGLWKKPGPWTTVPQRMLQMRARAFALRDTFADALAGMHAVEEIADVVDVTATATVHQEPRPAKARTVDATTEAQKPADAPPADQGQGTATDPPAQTAEAQTAAVVKDTSVETCTREFEKLWKHSDAGKSRGRAILGAWNIAKIAELAGAADGDREAFLVDVGEGLAAVGA